VSTALLGYDQADFSDYDSAGVALQRTLPSGWTEYVSQAARANAAGWCGSSAKAPSRRSYPIRRPGGIASIDAMPVAIYAHWWRLRGLPMRVFNDLVSAATAPNRASGKASPLSDSSLGLFLDLWDTVKVFAAEPVVSVTPSGCVIAEWVQDGGNLLAVLAGSSAELTYSLFDNGEPVEDSVGKEQFATFVASMRARAANPFRWSDA